MQTSSTTKETVQPETRRRFYKRIGSTTYEVGIHFSDTSRETMNDKILRLIKNDTLRKAAGE